MPKVDSEEGQANLFDQFRSRRDVLSAEPLLEGLVVTMVSSYFSCISADHSQPRNREEWHFAYLPDTRHASQRITMSLHVLKNCWLSNPWRRKALAGRTDKQSAAFFESTRGFTRVRLLVSRGSGDSHRSLARREPRDAVFAELTNLFSGISFAHLASLLPLRKQYAGDGPPAVFHCSVVEWQ